MQDINLDFIRALSWITCTKYALIGTAKLEFQGVVFPADCNVPGINMGACSETGNSVLEAYGYTLPIYIMVLAMFGFLIVLHLVSFLALSKLH